MAERVVCYHDGMPLQSCISPLTLTVGNDLGNGTQHTLLVSFMDVCGNERNSSFTYSSAGIVSIPDIDYAVPVMYESDNTTVLPRNSAALMRALPGQALAWAVVTMILALQI